MTRGRDDEQMRKTLWLTILLSRVNAAKKREPSTAPADIQPVLQDRLFIRIQPTWTSCRKPRSTKSQVDMHSVILSVRIGVSIWQQPKFESRSSLMMSSHAGTNIELDILAQNARINTIFTQLVFCFHLKNHHDTHIHSLINSFEHGLARLNDAFPWTTGKVIQEDDSYTIRTRERQKVEIQVLRDEASFPDWQLLSSQDYPYIWLDEDKISARKTIADAAELATGLPVFAVKLNVIKEGLIVSFDCQHGSMDMAGQVQVVRLFAKACRGESFTASELEIGNSDRRAIKFLLSNEVLGLSPDGSAPSNEMQQPTIKENVPALHWAYFRFHTQRLADLKSAAMQDVPQDSFVSTDDVLSAFIWQAISRVRAARLPHAGALSSTLSRNVDARVCLSLPSTYPGLMVTSTIHKRSFDELKRTSLGHVALQLRAALEPTKLKRQILQQMSNVLQGTAGKAQADTRGNPVLDVRLSSWAKESCYDVDFGPGLGSAQAVRTPRFDKGAREGLVYFLPKDLSGDIVVGLCLRGNDMAALQDDALMQENAKYI